MKAFLKFLLLLLAIPVIAAIVLHLFLNPNDYKDEISAWVEERSGRRLTLEGDLRLSFFPWVGIEIHRARLAQPPGFGEQPFLRVQVAQARLSLPDLMQGRLALGEVLGTGWSLHLIRAPDGRTNWVQWQGPSAELNGAVQPELTRPASPRPGATSPQVASAGAVRPLPAPLRAAWEEGEAPVTGTLPAATGEGLVLTGVRLLWDDQENGNQMLVEDLGVRIPRLDPAGPLDLNLTGQLAGLEGGRPAHLALEAQTRLPAANQDLVLSPFSLSLADLALGEHHQVKAELRGNLTADLRAGTYRYTGLDLALEVSGGGLAGKPLRLTGRGEADHDARTGTLVVRDLVLDSGTLHARGGAAATGLDDQPVWQGDLNLEPLDARAWLQALGLSLPPMADPAALSRLALVTAWRWAEGRLDLSELDVSLDQTRVGGTWSWVPGARDAHTFDLKAERFVLDAYLPPARVAGWASESAPGIASVPVSKHGSDLDPVAGLATAPASAPPQGLPSPEQLPQAPPSFLGLLITEAVAQTPSTPLPLVTTPTSPAWDALSLDGRVRVGQLTWRGLKFDEFDGQLSGQDGQFQLRERVARFYGGSLSGQVDLDARLAVPSISLRQKAVGVSVADLLGDLLRREARLSGRADLEADLRTRGLTQPELVASLSGRGALRMPEGQLQGIDLDALVQNIEAQIRGQAKPPQPSGGGRTRFSQLQATAQIEQGILETQDLRVAADHFKASGTGRIDLPREELDLKLEARVDQAPPGSALEQIKGVAIPVRVMGSFQSLEYRLDPGPVIEELARRRLQRELGGPDDNALQQLEQRTGIRGLEQGLKSLLGR